jgi:hypothetical protein
MKLYGWYSIEAYMCGTEFVYLNPDNQLTLCTCVTHNKVNPYGITGLNKDAIYCGEVTTLVYSQPKFD